MTTHVLAAIFGPFEMILLLVLLASPVILLIAHFFFLARFNNRKLDLGMTEAKLLSDLAQLEADYVSGRGKDVSASTRREPGPDSSLQIAKAL